MITILAVGKLKEKYLKDMCEDYKKRISKYHKIELIELKDSNIEAEAKLINNYIKPNQYIVALDIDGKQLSTLEFRDFIENKFNNDQSNILFIIGGSDGIHEDIKKKVDFRLSFSKMTFPHGLFRSILLEQIYRIFKIMNNESYHK